VPFSFFLGGVANCQSKPNQRAPIGVGHMLVSSEDVERSGLQGRGVELLHLFQDKLWFVTFVKARGTNDLLLIH